MAKKGEILDRTDGIVVKAASEMGYTHKRHTLMYKGVCPDCGGEVWKSHKNYLGKRCFNCARKYSSGRLSAQVGDRHPRWKQGKTLNAAGYVLVALPLDSPYLPMANRHNHFVLEHRLVVAMAIGRCLESWEIVHHKNGVKEDNRLENLERLPRQSEHNTLRESYIKKLEKRIDKLEVQVKLLQWHISEMRYGNAVLNSGEKPDKCVETIYSASQEDDDIVHSQAKV